MKRAGIVLAIVGLAVTAVGLPVYMTARATPLHPEPQSAPAVAQADPSPQWSEAVNHARQVIRAALAEQNLPGVSVAVGAGGDLVWAEGFGWADTAARVPVTPDTRFQIGTASQALTSAAVGTLLEQGRLNLDAEIQTYVPQFPRKQWPLTVRQLMGHVGGVGTNAEHERPLSSVRCEQPVEALPHFAAGELLFEPGTKHQRSNEGWAVVSAAIEAAAGEPFLTFMREQVFEPLAMAATGAESATEENPDGIGEAGEDPPPFTAIRHLILEPLGIVARRPPAANRATLYAAGWGPRPVYRHGLHERHPGNLSCYAGAMAFFSTPSDLVRFGLAIDNGTLLQPVTVELLQTSQQLSSGQHTGYGLGWDLETATLAGQPTAVAGVNGELRGRPVISLMMFRDHGIVVAVTSNVSGADTHFLAVKVAEAFVRE